MTSQPAAVTAEYRALYKYLAERFEDLPGSRLPGRWA
jgi:hypothetical protein